MRYAKIVFDTKELMQDAPREELAAAGAACETGPAREGALFVLSLIHIYQPLLKRA